MAETSPHEQHEVLFKWPHTEPNHVILTGSFDDWSKSINLTKTQTGFEARIRLPYNEKTPYKFIVDGTWLVDESNPTGYDNIGNLNNIYHPPPQPPAHKLTPPTTPVVIGGFDTSKETSPGTASGKANGAPNGGYVPKVEGGDEKRRSSSRLSLSDFANTVAARDGISSAYEYVKSGLGAVIGGVVGVDPINAGQIAIPTPNTATSFNTQVEPPTPAPAPELAPKVPIGIVPVNSTEHNTIATENGNAGAANGDIHTHSPVVSPVKDRSEPSPVPVKEAEKAPEVPVSILPVVDKETAQPAAPLPETTTVSEPAPVAPAVETAAPAPAAEEEDKKVEEKLADLAAAEPTAAPVSEELLDKAVPTPLGPIIPPEATKEEESVPAPTPVAAPVEEATPAPAAEAAPTKPEEKVERPSTPPAAAPAAAAPSAPSTPSKPSKAPTASAPSTPLSIKKGTSNGSHFKRGSLSGTFGSIRGKKEGKEKDKKKEKEEDTSSSSSGSSDAGDGVGKDGKKKKKRESILHKIKRVLTPHHHDHHHHHHHHHQHENGEKKEEETKA